MTLKNGMEMTIAKAVREDAAELVAYLNIVGGESDNLTFGANERSITVEWEEQFIERVSKSTVSALLVGRIDGEVACIGSIDAHGRERMAHLANIALSVKKKFWNLGVGTHMMKALIDFARGNGKTEVLHLGVISDNVHAIKLYKNLGFEEIGLYKKFFKVNGVYKDEILMNLYL